MATGTVKWFSQALLDLGNKVHNLSTDTFKLGIVTAGVVPTRDTDNPHWNGTGVTNFATNQVATGGTSYTAPITLTSVSWTIVAGVPTLRADIVSLLQDLSGFTNAGYAIIYNSTDTNKRAVAFVEISAAGTQSIVTGPLTIDWNGGTNDIVTLTQP